MACWYGTTALIKNSEISEEDMKRLTPHASAPPRLYRLPKIHKKDVPLRPTMNCIGYATYTLAKYLTGLLRLLVGQSNCHIRNSEAFMQKLQSIKLQEMDILVSFDVVLLFTIVPLDDTIQLLSAKFNMQTVDLFRHVLTTTYFLYDGSFYDQKDGVAMGLPLAPVIANFYMEHFEQKAISAAIKKPARWYRYVDDIFTMWSHGKDDLQDFLLHLNSIHKSIKFTMEIEHVRTLLFLDVLVSRRLDGILGHMVYRKSTHTDLYLHAKSEHHPPQKRAVLTTLI
jgi:hypothetical protein